MILDPECFKNRNIFFLKADGRFYPCCYTSSSPVLREFLGPELTKQLNVNDYSLEQIMKSEAWKKINDMIISDDPIGVCRQFCRKREKIQGQDLVDNIRTILRTD